MASLNSVDQYVKRVADGYYAIEPFLAEVAAATGAIISNAYQLQRTFKYIVPSLESGVSAYTPIGVQYTESNSQAVLIAKVINFGSLNIGTNVYTVGAAMPTVDELGESTQPPASILIEVTTALNATPGTLTLTYTDQDGNTGVSSLAMSLVGNSVVKAMTQTFLAAGDYGALELTNAVRTSGTTPTGVLQFWGTIPICFIDNSNFNKNINLVQLISEQPSHIRLDAGDVIIGIGIGGTVVRGVLGWLSMVGDT